MFEEFSNLVLAEMRNTFYILGFSLLVFGVTSGIFKVIEMVLRRRGVIELPLEKANAPFALLAALISGRILSISLIGPLTELSSQVFQIFLIILLVWLSMQLVAIGTSILRKQYNIDAEDNLKARKVITQLRVFERIIVVVIIVIGVSLCLMTFESIKNIGASILASAGLTGIIVGLAAQKLIANLLAGFQIAVTQPIRIDDVVIVESEWGRIEEITLTYVVIKIWDQRRLVVPSSHFIEKPFQNWTRTNSDILGTVFIHVDYQIPIGMMRKKLSQILKGTSLWDGKVDVLQVTNLTEKTIELRALMSAQDSPTAWDLRVHVREKMLNFLQQWYPEYLPKTRVTLENGS